MSLTTSSEYRLGPVAAIPLGEGRVFQIGERRVAVFHTRSGALYATQAECPHRSGPLADGLVGGDTLICPLHAWKFDLATGAAKMGDCGLVTYPVRMSESGEIILTVEEAHLMSDAVQTADIAA
jgi:nitrite reductase (NADH) small subunit